MFKQLSALVLKHVYMITPQLFSLTDQRRMAEIIDYLTKMRFGDQEQNRSKDTKEVCVQ